MLKNYRKDIFKVFMKTL